MNLSLKRLCTSGALSLILCFAFIVAGLWPFEFFPENKVDWVNEPSGLRFRGRSDGSDGGAGGLAFTPQPLGSAGNGVSFSIEIRLRCNREPRGSLPGILVFCDEEKRPSLFLGQWKSCLVVRRFNTTASHGKRWKEASVCNALTEGTTRFITVTSNGSECVFYVDGVPKRRYPRFSLLPQAGSLQGHYLLLGNTPESKNGWIGDILGVALYDRFLGEDEVMESYRAWTRGQDGSSARRDGLFLQYEFQKETEEKVFDHSGRDNDLLIPPYAKFATRLLTPLEIVGIGRSFVMDAVVNVLGFIPFGLSLCIFLAGRTRLAFPMVVAAGTLGGAAISLFIEVVQSQIPVRTSSTADLMSNTLGAGLGALIFAIIHARKGFLTRGESNHVKQSGR